MDPFHERLAQVGLAALARYGFALAGGYAVQAHGLLERPSEDVDMFTTLAAEPRRSTLHRVPLRSLTFRARSVLLLAVGAGLLAGCAGTTPDRAATGPSTVTTPTTASGVATRTSSRDKWVPLVDQSSGVRFALPHDVQPTTSNQTLADGTSAQARLYVDDVDGIQVSFSALIGRVDPGAYDARASFEQLVTRMRQVGADDAKVSDVRDIDLGGRPAVEGTISFTSAQGQRSYWRTCAAWSENAIVTVQAQVFTEASDIAEKSRAVDALFGQAVSHVEFPS